MAASMVDKTGVSPLIQRSASGDREVEFANRFDDAVAARISDFIRHSSSDEDEFLVIIGHLELPSGAVFTTLLSRCNGNADLSYPGIEHRRGCATCRPRRQSV